MTLPGFTADISLYRTNGQYHTTKTRAQSRGMVSPAQSDRTRWKLYDPYGPLQLKCAPLTVCHPLSDFCDLCTEYDENCRQSTYESCLGVPITRPPINLPDPVIDRITVPKRVGGF